MGLDKGFLRRLGDQQLVTPYLENAIISNNWPDHYSVEIDSRPYYGFTDLDGEGGKGGSGDGYFHPSTHPLMGERQLYYAFHPVHSKKAVYPGRSLQGEMTLAMGSALHGIVQAMFVQSGILREENVEVEYVDEVNNTRGRIDFIVDHPTHGRLPVELKALDVETEIKTTEGWTTMGALQGGEYVYGTNGKPTKVLAAHPWRTGRPCYKLTTKTGWSVVADAEHLWTVKDRILGRDVTVTTEYLAKSVLKPKNSAYRFSLVLPEPLEFEEKELPVDPWLLGYWLGDGTKYNPSISVGHKDLDWFVSKLDSLGLSYKVNTPGGFCPWVYIHNLRGKLVELGVLRNKHIPRIYLDSSREQRLELARGLWDSDGTAGGRNILTTSIPELSRDIQELMRSLGYRFTKPTKHRTGYKADGKWVEGSGGWSINIPSQYEDNLFSMPRKAEVFERKYPKGEDYAKTSIVSVESVESRPTRCITVDSEDHLYLVTRDFVPTHNTMNSFSFANLTEIKESWDIQLSMGLDNVDCDYGVLLVLESGWPYTMKEFRVPRNDEKLSQVYEKFENVREALETDTPPRHCCSLGSPQMKSCPFRFSCWLGEE